MGLDLSKSKEECHMKMEKGMVNEVVSKVEIKKVNPKMIFFGTDVATTESRGKYRVAVLVTKEDTEKEMAEKEGSWSMEVK